MPFRFQRRFRAGPFRMNLSKRGASMSVGTKGAWFTTGNGRQRVSVGIPGTGLGWYRQRPWPQSPTPSTPASVLRSLAVIIAALAVVALLFWH